MTTLSALECIRAANWQDGYADGVANLPVSRSRGFRREKTATGYVLTVREAYLEGYLIGARDALIDWQARNK